LTKKKNRISKLKEKTFTTQKIYGPIEFFLTVIDLDNVAPKYGKRKLEDFF